MLLATTLHFAAGLVFGICMVAAMLANMATGRRVVNGALVYFCLIAAFTLWSIGAAVVRNGDRLGEQIIFLLIFAVMHLGFSGYLAHRFRQKTREQAAAANPAPPASTPPAPNPPDHAPPHA